MPTDPELQKGYAKVLMNDIVNWRKHVICSAHWSNERKLQNQLPDVICTHGYVEKLGDWGDWGDRVRVKTRMFHSRARFVVS